MRKRGYFTMTKYYTETDMKKAYEAGANKKTWTETPLNNVILGTAYILQPIFKNWFKKYNTK